MQIWRCYIVKLLFAADAAQKTERVLLQRADIQRLDHG